MLNVADDTNRSGDQRSERGYPGKGGAAPPPRPTAPLQLGAPRLVAPTRGAGSNAIHFTTWFEVRLLSPHGGPIADEQCQLFTPKGEIVEKKTDKSGVVRFDNLPLVPPEGTDWRDTANPAVVFPDILEEWVDNPPGAFGKNQGQRDDHRKRDGMVHFIPNLETRTDITPNTLTIEQKMQHFIQTHVDNGAKYVAGMPRGYSSDRRRWEWNQGSVCNMHVNFFLGYWFNYNDKFSDKGSSTAFAVLPLFNSNEHKFPKDGQTVKERCYLEFLEPLPGYGAAIRTAYDPMDESTWPSDGQWNRAAYSIKYTRIAQYFNFDGTATDDGEKFIDALGPVNVYSVADIKSSAGGKKNPAVEAEKAVRAWLKKHRAERADGETDTQIDAKTSSQLWRVVFDLDEDDVIDRELINKLEPLRDLSVDHHCGVLLVGEKGGTPAVEVANARELWTFSADNNNGPGTLFAHKTFERQDLRRKFLHLGLWRLRPLVPGGFAPEKVAAKVGDISTDAPPRFIHWGPAGK